ncbi:MAG TPA: extracellular solute-binding protein, partial [Pseudonocardiaceae bacterium]
MVGAGLVIGGCGGSSADSGSSGPVTLTFWGTYGNGGNKAETDALNKVIIPAFEKQHPNIKVNYVDVPYSSLEQKLETGAAGGELPDLIRSDITWVPKFASLGVFAQLDGSMPDFDSLAKADYPGTLAANKWNGHYYGLPLDTNTRVEIS